MEDATLVTKSRLLPRLALKAAMLGAIGFLVGYGSEGARAGITALAGCLIAGIYSWGYIASHLARADRHQFVDRGLLGQTALRITALGLVSAAVFLLGRTAFIPYLIAFAAAFAVLLVSEAPRVTKELRSRGMIG